MDFNSSVEKLWTYLKPGIAGQIRHGLSAVAALIGGWGALKDPGSQAQFIDIGTGIALYAITAGWAWWTNTGQAFVKDYVKVLVAKTQAQAQALRLANQPQVTVKQITQQSDLTLQEVSAVIPKLPVAVQQNIAPSPLVPPPVVKAIVLFAILVLSALMLFSGSASAQVRTRPTKKTIPAAAPVPAPAASEASGTLPTLSAWAPKPHLLKLLNPLGWPDPMCITDHPSKTCPANTVNGGGIKQSGNPQTDFTDFISRGGITFVRDMKRADQFLSYPCKPTDTGCTKTDLLSSNCLEAIIPIAELIVNGPPSLVSDAPTATPSTPPSGTSPTTAPNPDPTVPTAPQTLNGLPAVQAANGTNGLMSTDSPVVTSADDGVVTAAAKLDVVYLAIQGPALKQGCGGWVQNQVTQFGSFAAGLMTFVTGLGLSGGVL